MIRIGSIFRTVSVLLAALAGAGALRAAAARLVLPEAHADRTVTFHLAWPNAGKVELVGRGPNQTDFPADSYPMVREGTEWRVTVGPLLPGVHFYKFRIDGMEFPDPANPVVLDFYNGPWSYFELPDPEPRTWTVREGVAHGVVERRLYPSRALGHERPAWVYLPPGYADLPRDARLPVLYLLHGSTYNERSWVELGRVSVILDNLIADGRVQPLIVVMPSGYSEPPQSLAAEPAKDFAPWAEHMLTDLVPWVERTYRAAPDRAHRAIAGLSMGGQQALHLGLSHLDVFAQVGGFSAGKNGLENYPAAYAPALVPGALRPVLVWLGCGRGDIHFESLKTLRGHLAADGLPVTWHEVEGRHTWRVWRECLDEFVRMAFPPVSAEKKERSPS